MKTTRALLGILTGIAAGTLIGVLVAPNKGARTRRKISRKSEELADAINNRIDQKFQEMQDGILGKGKRGTQKESETKPVE